MRKNNNYLLPVISFYSPVMSAGEGTYIYDQNGKRYLDLNAGQFCSVLGHSNPDLANCIAQNAQKIAHTNTEILTEDVLTAAENINRISGDLDAYSIFLSTGAECVEFCLRYAKHIQQKEGVVCFNKGYHGLTLGAQSVTYSGVYARPTVGNVYNVSIPDTFICSDELQFYVEEFETVLRCYGDRIAAVLMEPIVSVGGMIFPPPAYFDKIRQICDIYNVLLIFDECQTGFGRTGTWFNYQQLECIPDMAACAKAMGLGYPVSMAMFSRKLVNENVFAMTHYSSHQNDAFAAAIINFGIEYMENNNLLSIIQDKGAFFLHELYKLEQRCEYVTAPRGQGLMLGLDLYIEGVENYRPFFRQLAETALDKGLIIQSTNGGKTLRFLPNYLITTDEINLCIAILEESLREIFSDL